VDSVRAGSAVAGFIAALVLITAMATDLHDVAWFVYYGWSAGDLPVGQAAPDSPAWLIWILVVLLALRWPRAAAVAAWAGLAGICIELAASVMLPTAQTGVWLLLALLSALGLTTAPRGFRFPAELGRQRVLAVAGGVAFVLFARLLGHQYTMIYTLAWVGLVAAIVYAARPRTVRGRWALLLLAVPAMSAALTELAVRMFAFNVYRPSLGWPTIVVTFYVAPLVVASALAVLLQRRGQAVAEPTGSGRP
jgi:hypothetical protein